MLKFQEIVTYSYEIDPSIVEDYLNDCKTEKCTPSFSNFLDYIFDNFEYDDLGNMSDFGSMSDRKFTLTDEEFNKYIKNFRTEFPND